MITFKWIYLGNCMWWPLDWCWSASDEVDLYMWMSLLKLEILSVVFRLYLGETDEARPPWILFESICVPPNECTFDIKLAIDLVELVSCVFNGDAATVDVFVVDVSLSLALERADNLGIWYFASHAFPNTSKGCVGFWMPNIFITSRFVVGVRSLPLPESIH